MGYITDSVMQTYSYLPSRIDASLTFGGHQIIRDQPDSLFQSRDIFREIGLWEKNPMIFHEFSFIYEDFLAFHSRKRHFSKFNS